MPVKSFAALIVATLSWGCATAVAKFSVSGLGPVTTLFVESATAASVLWAAMLRVRPRRTTPLRSYIYLAALEPIVTYGALDLGLQHAGAANAAMLDGLESAIVLVLAVCFMRELPNRRTVVGLLTATFGALLIFGVHISRTELMANGLVLIGSVGGSASVIVVSRLAVRSSPLELTAYQFGFGFLGAIPVAIVQWTTGREEVPGYAKLPQLAAAAGIGVIGFALAYLAYNYAVAHVPVTLAGMALNMIPIYGLGASLILFGAGIGVYQIAGGALIIAGIALFPLRDVKVEKNLSMAEDAPG